MSNAPDDEPSDEQTAPTPPDEAAPATAPCPVVGLGASAGGIEAFRRFFENTPRDTGLAYVVVLHLNPETRSHLPEVLARHSAVPVEQVTEATRLAPDRIYVMAPGTVLSLDDGMLIPRPLDDTGSGRRTPIDQFFFSLAASQGQRAACIVLSGTGSDGTIGMRAVKEHGGLCLVQSPETAEYGDMMNSAVATGLVDRVMDVEDMPAAIAEYFARLEDDDQRVSEDGTRQDVAERLPRITALLKEHTRQDFSNYKRGTLLRRVQRRMNATGITEPDAYLERLSTDVEEPRQLLKDLLIGITEFFRDPAAFAALRDTLVPNLFEGRGGEDALRAWVPGCATGEEAYSIAILLLEHAAAMDDPPDITVFATDIDANALEVGRQGHYPPSALEHVPEALVERYFENHGDVYVVRNVLRERILFAEHNVLRDPPFSRLDLISCRNLLIYLQGDIQGSVIQIFHYALRDDGYLFLGSSETVGRQSSQFTTVDRQRRVYRRVGTERTVPKLPLTPRFDAGRGITRGSSKEGKMTWNDLVDRMILDRHSPAWAVVGEDMKVRTFSKRAGRYFDTPPGAPTSDVLNLVTRQVRPALRSALAKAFRTGEPVTTHNLAIETGGEARRIDLIVEPLPKGTNGVRERLCLVVFDHAESYPSQPEPERRQAQDETNNHEISEELRETRERLQVTSDELDTANQELKLSNEELQSANEELQSANEELETSKEELQSSNEELQTVNAQLQERVQELALANDDLRNLFENTAVPTLFVDKDLRIRNYTPALTTLFHVLESDKDRPLEHIAHRLADGHIIEDVKGVMRDLQRVEREISSDDGNAVYTLRIQPYRTLDNRIEGAVLTFSEVTRIKDSERRLEESERHQRLLLRELQHRVKNILANVRGLARQTLPESRDLNEFYQAFEGRLEAIGRAQSLYSPGLEGHVNLTDLILEELLAHTAQPGRNADVEGPTLLIEPRAAQTIALTIHELTTNAVKYGALANDDGHVSVSWRVEDRDGMPHMVLEWRETGVSLGPDDGRTGFGRRLIEEAAPYELGGQCRLELLPDGCRCVMEIPFDGRIRLGAEAPTDGDE